MNDKSIDGEIQAPVASSRIDARLSGAAKTEFVSATLDLDDDEAAAIALWMLEDED